MPAGPAQLIELSWATDIAKATGHRREVVAAKAKRSFKIILS